MARMKQNQVRSSYSVEHKLDQESSMQPCMYTSRTVHLHVGVQDADAVQLVAKAHPARLAVVLPRKDLQLPCAGAQPLQQRVQLVGLPGCLSHLHLLTVVLIICRAPGSADGLCFAMCTCTEQVGMTRSGVQ
jgi:hypothetical protein